MATKGFLFLSGGGDKEQTVEIDQRFFSLLPVNAKILYVQAAMPEDSFPDCETWFRGLLGFHDRGDISFLTVSRSGALPSFAAFDAIYIWGGNTYELLAFFHSNGAKRRFREYLENGGTVYGGSAGAIVMWRSVATVEEENETGTENHEGFDFVAGFSIRCHFAESETPLLQSLPDKVGTDIMMLPEESGLIVHGDEIESFGEVFVFRRDGT